MVFVENEHFPRQEVVNSSVSELVPVRVPVHLSEVHDQVVTVDFATVDVGEADPGLDYVSKTGSIDFLPGETLKWIDLQIVGDAAKSSTPEFLGEGPALEKFEVVLSNPINATLGDASADVTIVDDDLTADDAMDCGNDWATFGEEVVINNEDPLDGVINITIGVERPDGNSGDEQPPGAHGAYLCTSGFPRKTTVDISAQFSTYDSYNADFGYWDSLALSLLNEPWYANNPNPIPGDPTTRLRVPFIGVNPDGTPYNGEDQAVPPNDVGTWEWIAGGEDFGTPSTLEFITEAQCPGVLSDVDGIPTCNWSYTYQRSLDSTDYIHFTLDTQTSALVPDGRHPSWADVTLVDDPWKPCDFVYFSTTGDFDTESFGPGYAFFTIDRWYTTPQQTAAEASVPYEIEIDGRVEQGVVTFDEFQNRTLVPVLLTANQMPNDVSLTLFNSECNDGSTRSTATSATSHVTPTNPAPPSENGPHVVDVSVVNPDQLVNGIPKSYSIPLGSAEQLVPIPLGSTRQITIGFDEPIDETTLSSSVIELVGLNSGGIYGTTYELTYEGFNSDTYVATWQLPVVNGNAQTFNQPDRMWLRLDDSITDTQGRNLDGEWINPVAFGESVPALPVSGDNNSGGEFRFGFVVVPGDGDQNWSVDVSDFNIWNSNKFTMDTSWQEGDYNGDGVTDNSDFNIWNMHKFTSVNLTTLADVNHDGLTTEEDVIHLFDAIFGRRVAETFDDLNGDGLIDDQDVIYLLDLLNLEIGDITMDGVADTEDVNLFLAEGSDVDNDGDVDMWDYFEFFFW